MLFGKKKKRIAFLLGCLWYYIKRMEDVRRFVEATDIMTDVCVELGIDWEQVNNAEKAYQTWDACHSRRKENDYAKECGLQKMQ